MTKTYTTSTKPNSIRAIDDDRAMGSNGGEQAADAVPAGDVRSAENIPTLWELITSAPIDAADLPERCRKPIRKVEF